MAAVGIEVTDVLSDITTSLSSSENDNLHHSIEVEAEDAAERTTDILKDSTSENSISANTADCEEDGTRVSFAFHYAVHAK